MSELSILFGHKDFSIAQNAMDEFHEKFKDDPSLEEINYQVSDKSIERLQSFIHDNRYALIGEDFVTAIQDSLNGIEFAKNNARQHIYGLFSTADLSKLEEDPFLLAPTAFEKMTLQSPLMKNNFTLKNSKLTIEDSSGTYILWNAKLSANVASFASDDHILQKMESAFASLKSKYAGLVIAKSGVPFHSYESSKNAQKEITWITTISISLVILLLIFIFRTPLPIFATLFSIAISALSSLAATWGVFHEIHVFTFVFGTSIIGISIDYSIHFFTDLKYSANKPNGLSVRKHIFKGLLLGFLTTEMGYIAISFAPFELLKQTAVFTIAGLASAFLTIVLLFSHLPQVAKTGKPKILQTTKKIANIYNWYYAIHTPAKIVLPILFLAICAIGICKLNIHTDLQNLYTMSDELKQSEILAGRLIDFGSSGDYFIIKGNSAEEVLQTEESFRKELDKAQKDSLFKQYLAVSSFIPSVKLQSIFHSTIQKALASEASSFLQELGFTNDSLFKASLHKFKPITLDDALPSEWEKFKKSLWIGKVNNSYYSTILPLHVKKASLADTSLKEIAKGFKNVVYVSKMPEINKALTHLSSTALILVVCADIAIFFILIFVYNLRTAFRIIRNPILASLITAAVFGYAAIDFNFFAIAGVILTLGIGIDYSLFFREGASRQDTTALAITLSAATTLLSFATLALSSFTPVATFGLSIFIGIVSNYLLSPMAQAKK